MNTRNTRKNKRSYSPSINKALNIGSLKSMNPNNLNLCNDLLKINIGSSVKPNCLNYNNKKVEKYLLNQLKGSKHLDPEKFIAPKQLYSNCWFNTMFVTFFFSDKGRKFFRFFREFMIKGQKINGEHIEDSELRQLFFILNLFIEASYNQTGTSKFKKTKKEKQRKKGIFSKTKKVYFRKGKQTLFDQINHLTNNLNTNFFIKIIHDRINEHIYDDLPNIDDAGNPLQFYRTIMNYLNYNVLKMMRINIDSKINAEKLLYDKFATYYVIPDIIILEDFESGTHYDKSYTLTKNNSRYKYMLDAIIITNKGHIKPQANSHFVSVLTINGREYKFDGDSYSKLSSYKWKNMINTNKDWKFVENPNYHEEKYNFTKGYKILFYYRS